MLEVFWTVASLITLITGGITIAARILTGHWGNKLSENGTTELTDEDRNLLRRVSRLLEENTSAQKKGRP